MLGVVVGWVTNALGMWLIFEPPEAQRILGIKVHGLFLRRQDEAAEVYAQIIADDVITLENIGDFLLDGPRGDRTRQMLADAMRPAIDNAAGPVRGAVRIAVGSRRFDNIRDAVAVEAVDRTLEPFKDPEFSRRQAEKIYALIAKRTKELPPRDFVEMMRSAIREDEWMLYAHGAIMGFGGGLLHLAIFGVGGTIVTDQRRHGRCAPSPALWDEAAEALPGMARIAATAWMRSAAWAVGSGVRSGQAASLRALTDPATAGELVQEVARDVAEASRTVSDVARAVSAGVPLPRALLDATVSLSSVVLADVDATRARGGGEDPARARRGPAPPVARRVERGRRDPSGVRADPGASWRPTRRASCSCCSAAARSRRSTSAPVVRSGWSARRWWRPGCR